MPDLPPLSLVADSFVSCFEHPVDPKGQGLKFYLLTIARNLAISHWRRIAAEKRALNALTEPSPSTDVNDPAEQVGKVEMEELIVEVLSRLPEKKRQAIELYYYDGKTDEEIGRILTVSKKKESARALRRRAIKDLGRILTKGA